MKLMTDCVRIRLDGYLPSKCHNRSQDTDQAPSGYQNVNVPVIALRQVYEVYAVHVESLLHVQPRIQMLTNIEKGRVL